VDRCSVCGLEDREKSQTWNDNFPKVNHLYCFAGTDATTCQANVPAPARARLLGLASRTKETIGHWSFTARPKYSTNENYVDPVFTNDRYTNIWLHFIALNKASTSCGGTALPTCLI
jgi:hypothetical protein